jgi:hypothetical protein
MILFDHVPTWGLLGHEAFTGLSLYTSTYIYL